MPKWLDDIPEKDIYAEYTPIPATPTPTPRPTQKLRRKDGDGGKSIPTSPRVRIQGLPTVSEPHGVIPHPRLPPVTRRSEPTESAKVKSSTGGGAQHQQSKGMRARRLIMDR